MTQKLEDLPQAFNDMSNRLARIEKALTASDGEPEDQVLDVKGAAELLDLRCATIYTKVSKGQIPYSRNAGKLRFSRNELVKWATGKNQ
jgi:excisionase family DNA binding protein